MTKFPAIDNNKLFDVLVDNNLSWDVHKEPAVRLINGQPVEVPNEFNLFKGNSGTDKFMSVGPDYEVLQNSQFVELALQVANFFGVEDLPTFKQYTKTYNKNRVEGGVVRATIPLKSIKPTGVKNVGDIVDVSITLTNSHDGSHGLQWGLYTKVLSCTNGMTFTKSQYKKSVRHLSNMTKMLENSISAFEFLGNAANQLESDITRLTNTPLTQERIQEVIRTIAGVDAKEAKNPELISTRKGNIIKEVSQHIMGEIAQKGATAWGLHNGVTRFVRDANRSDYAKDYGVISTLVNKSYDYLLKESEKPLKGQTTEFNMQVLMDDFQLAMAN